MVSVARARLLVPVVAAALCLSMWPSLRADAAVSGVLRSSLASGIAGELIVFSGNVPPRQSRTVVLQRNSGSGWAEVSRDTSTSTGTFRFPTKVPSTSSNYRVLAPQARLGGRLYAATKTPAYKVTTLLQSGTLSVPSRVTAGDTFSASASFRPVRAGRPVRLEVWKEDAWATVEAATQSSSGAASFTLKDEVPQTLTYRATSPKYQGAARVVTDETDVEIEPRDVADSTPPPVPSGVSAAGANGEATITWSGVSANDLFGYHVYRATSSSGPWTRITSASTPGTSYRATSLANGTTYWFSVTSIDAAGNESQKATPALARPVAPDTTPPSAPTGLVASAGDSSIALTWSAVSASDLASYSVEMSTTGSGPWTLVAENLITNRADLDGLTNETSYFLRVLAKDRSGNISNASAVTSAQPSASSPSISEHCGTLVGDQNWSAGTVHMLTCDTVVPAGVTLTVDPGTVIKSGTSAGLAVAGTLGVNGSASSPVTFTGIRDDSVGGDTNRDGGLTSPAAGQWDGISASSRARVTLDNTTIAWTQRGFSSSGADQSIVRESVVRGAASTGIEISVDRSGADAGGATIKVSDNSVTNVGSIGISVRATGSPLGSGTVIPVPEVSNNTVTNAGSAAVRVYGTALNGSLLRGNNGTGSKPNQIQVGGTLKQSIAVPLGGFPLGLESNLTVAPGAAMTIAGGEVIQSSNGAGLLVQGSLVASGGIGSPVTFTSLRDDNAAGDTNGDAAGSTPAAGNWGGISATSRSSLTLDRAVIAYATTSVSSSGADVAVVRNSTIRNGSYTGINVSVDRSGADAGGATVQVTDTAVSNVGGAGIHVSATGRPAGSGTTIPVPKVSDNTVTNAGGVAIRVHGDALNGALLRGNNGTSSAPNQIQLSGTLKQDLAVPLGGLPLGASDSSTLSVAVGATMTVAAGQVIKTRNSGFDIAGTLDVNGTADNPVTFTSVRDDTIDGDTNDDSDATTPYRGDWHGISASGRASVTLDRAVVAYATTSVSSSGADVAVVRNSTIRNGSYTGINVSVDRSGADAGGATVQVTDTAVSNVGGAGIHVSATGRPAGSGTTIPVPKVSDNTVTNAGGVAIRVHGDALNGALLRGNNGTSSAPNQIQLSGTLKQDLAVPLGGLPLGASDSSTLSVAVGATMTVAAGQVIKTRNSGFDIAGTLDVNGTADNPVTFTSVRDDTIDGDTNDDSDATSPKSGDWDGISAGSDASMTLDHTTLAYGGGVDAWGADVAVVRSSTVRDADSSGIYLSADRTGADAGSATMEVSGTTVRNVRSNGIYVSATGAAHRERHYRPGAQGLRQHRHQRRRGRRARLWRRSQRSTATRQQRHWLRPQPDPTRRHPQAGPRGPPRRLAPRHVQPQPHRRTRRHHDRRRRPGPQELDGRQLVGRGRAESRRHTRRQRHRRQPRYLHLRPRRHHRWRHQRRQRRHLAQVGRLGRHQRRQRRLNDS